MDQKSATAYRRHQHILQMLDELESVRVTDLAERLNVSESTIRTDLEELDEQGQLTRVRGGAVAKVPSSTISSDYLDQKISRNREQKSWIARWAASLIEDGDAIMLDASSTVMHIAQYLTDRRDLVVFTNGVKVAQLLAKERSNTVILLGGILRPNGNALTGGISEGVLRDYHIRRAFLSCSAFVPELGFFESDLQEAQMKTLMLKATQQRVILCDASKIGQVGLTTFATLEDINYMGVDARVTPATIEEIRSGGAHVVVCGEQTTRNYAPRNKAADVVRVGFANLSEHTPFSRDVRRGLEQAAQQHGGVELVLADNQLNSNVALQVADQLLTQALDLVIEYQVDEDTGNLIAHKFQQAHVPLIAVDIPMVGATYFGVDNYLAGKLAGVELGRAILRDWGGAFDTLIVVEQTRTGKLPAMRIHGQLEGLASVLGSIPAEKIVTLDFDNTVENAYDTLYATLGGLPPSAQVAIICFNDDAAVGALEAARVSGWLDQIKLVGQGADRRLRLEMRKDHGALVGATAFSPERYGQQLLQLAFDILGGRQVPPAVYMSHFFVSPSNVDVHYPTDIEEVTP